MKFSSLVALVAMVVAILMLSACGGGRGLYEYPEEEEAERPSSGGGTATGNQPPDDGGSSEITPQLTLAVTSLGLVDGRVRSAVDDVFSLKFTARGGAVMLQRVTLSFHGTAVPFKGSDFPVTLIDLATGSSIGVSVTHICRVDSSGVGQVTFEPGYLLDADGVKLVRLRVDSSSFANWPSQKESLTVTVGELQWDDGLPWEDDVSLKVTIFYE